MSDSCCNHGCAPTTAASPRYRRVLWIALVINAAMFVVEGGRAEAFAVCDALELIDISNNIGDSRSLMTHPSSTTHSGVAEEKRIEMGVSEGMIRINVGLEDPEDVIADLDQALRAVAL